jgi:Zn-finger protein
MGICSMTWKGFEKLKMCLFCFQPFFTYLKKFGVDVQFAQSRYKIWSWFFIFEIHSYGSFKECLKHVLPCYKHKK